MTKPNYLTKRRRMRVIGRDPLTKALDEAVQRGLDAASPGRDTVEVNRVKRIVRMEFGKLVQESADKVQSVPKSEVMAELRAQEEERSRSELGSQSEDGTGTRRAFSPRSFEDDPQSSETEQERIERYERRIEKLMGSLARAEEALRQVSSGGAVVEGIASRFRGVQGLAQEVESFQLKHALLTQLLEANLALRKGTRPKAS